MSHAAIAMHDLIGRVVGRFAIKARLGYGGMGEVFLAEDRLLRRQVALKAIKREHSLDEKSRRRLLKEAERASQLNNEYVARIYDIVEDDGSMFLVMEYVEGETMRARLREPLSTEEFFHLAEQCLSGLGAAHGRGILHCDLKPENLMIMPAGDVKILDFGFSRKVETNETRDSLELSNVIAGGTPAYMAPEVLLGGAPDERSDIFALGVVFYEAVTGRHPFRSEGNQGTAARILREDPFPVPAGAPAGLDEVLGRMLARDPAQRYQSCADVLADIQAIHAGRRPVARAARWKNLQLSFSTISLTLAIAIVAALLLPRIVGTAKSPEVVSASSRQLVVLPFKPVTDDGNSRAFANGLTETLAAKLGQIADRYPLEIISLSEAQKQKVSDAQQARAILGATMTLEGGMQLSANMVRISYKLVDTRSLRQLHSGVITADASNYFAVQDRVIDEVLKNLDIELAKEDRGRMQEHGTTHPEAYAAYLRGQGYLHEYDRPENLQSAVTAFQQSTQADPQFALAYAGMGQALMYQYAISHQPDSVSAAKDACTRAVQLNSAGADGEICLGMLFDSTGEYERAAQHLERAIRIDPARGESYRELGRAYEGLNRLADAESVLKQAIALRPQYWAGYLRLGKFYSKNGRDGDAVEQFNRVVDLAPDSFTGYSNLGGIYSRQGKYALAIGMLERSIAIRPAGGAYTNLGVAYFYEHRYQEAAASYEKAAQARPNEYAIFGNLGEAYDQIPGKQDESRNSYIQALQLAEQRLKVNTRDASVLMDAAFYAAMLGQKAKADQYRQAGLRLSVHDPNTRLRSARVLAQFHQDKRALAELSQALKAGLSSTEISNDPAWQRYAAYPEFVAMMTKAEKENTK